LNLNLNTLLILFGKQNGTFVRKLDRKLEMLDSLALEVDRKEEERKRKKIGKGKSFFFCWQRSKTVPSVSAGKWMCTLHILMWPPQPSVWLSPFIWLCACIRPTIGRSGKRILIFSLDNLRAGL
jgi:hypothetical protein